MATIEPCTTLFNRCYIVRVDQTANIFVNGQWLPETITDDKEKCIEQVFRSFVHRISHTHTFLSRYVFSTDVDYSPCVHTCRWRNRTFTYAHTWYTIKRSVRHMHTLFFSQFSTWKWLVKRKVFTICIYSLHIRADREEQKVHGMVWRNFRFFLSMLFFVSCVFIWDYQKKFVSLIILTQQHR